jgi:methylated-DNA-[protein]-cysteine S-methyltransferase
LHTPIGDLTVSEEDGAIVALDWGWGSARSVGQANGCNPIPIIIPCHRVVATTHLGGYSGGEGPPTKRYLLALEARETLL